MHASAVFESNMILSVFLPHPFDFRLIGFVSWSIRVEVFPARLLIFCATHPRIDGPMTTEDRIDAIRCVISAYGNKGTATANCFRINMRISF